MKGGGSRILSRNVNGVSRLQRVRVPQLIFLAGQKLRARQRSVSQPSPIHHKPDESFQDYHMWQLSSAPTAQAIHGPGNDSQGIISFENLLLTDGLGP